MDRKALEFAAYLVHRLKSIRPESRLLIALAGIPASGKSSLAALIVTQTNALLESTTTTDRAILVGLDGWHLTRKQLNALPDPVLAHARRGIHWTFDASAYAAFVLALRRPLNASEPAILGPTFDHAVKDPSPGALAIDVHHRIVLIEGLYACLAVGEWCTPAIAMDERWLVEVCEDVARARLVKRHVVTGVAKDMEEAELRADENDMPNGRFIMENVLEPVTRIQSVDDPVFAL